MPDTARYADHATAAYSSNSDQPAYLHQHAALDYSCVADLKIFVTCYVPCPVSCKLEVTKRRTHECRIDGHVPQQLTLQAYHRYRCSL